LAHFGDEQPVVELSGFEVAFAQAVADFAFAPSAGSCRANGEVAGVFAAKCGLVPLELLARERGGVAGIVDAMAAEDLSQTYQVRGGAQSHPSPGGQAHAVDCPAGDRAARHAKR
jgi:hypothetical protein